MQSVESNRLFLSPVLLERLTSFDCSLSSDILGACKTLLPRAIEKPQKEDEPSKLRAVELRVCD
jgi:hypothetical protein